MKNWLVKSDKFLSSLPEVGVAASDESGGLYVFEYSDVDSFRQVACSNMPTLEVGREEEAIRCQMDPLVELQPDTDDLAGPLVRARNQSRELLCAIDVQEAQAAQQNRQ